MSSDPIFRKVSTSTPTSIDGLSRSRATHHLDTANANILHVNRVSSCDEHRRVSTIHTLPDDVLLHIFLFDRVTFFEGLGTFGRLPLSWRWDRLVHVCQRWRSVVFASPNFLGLKLVCHFRTRVELIGIWPPLPIIIRNRVDLLMPNNCDFDAAIVHHNRVCEINLLRLNRRQLQQLASAMRDQFPVLIHLTLEFTHSYNRLAPPLPDRFLGGSAPRLQYLTLRSIPFPALPKFLLSTTNLVHLNLRKIPHSGYISPEAIVTGLAVLTNLERLSLGFLSPLSRPDIETRRPLPPTRTVLPALTRFEFRGVGEYLEDLVARIDAPLLGSLWVTLFHQLIFDISQLPQFVRRISRFEALNEAHVDFGIYGVWVESHPPTRSLDEKSGLGISCSELDRQLSSLPQIFTSFFPSIYMVEHLHVYGPLYLQSEWQGDIENMQWLEILRPFTFVKNLYVSKEFAHCIAPALQELAGERLTNMLPALETLFLEALQPSGPVQEAIGKFIAARQLLGRPVAISDWNRT